MGVVHKFFTFLANISLIVSFWFLTLAAKSVGVKCVYKIDELEDKSGYNVHVRWVNHD